MKGTQREQSTQSKDSHRDTKTQSQAFLSVSVSLWLITLCVLGQLGVASAQQPPVPQPFPRPGSSQPARPATPAPAPPITNPPARADGVPTEATLGVPIYPGAQFLTSYDAGRGQRYYIFGSTAAFVDLVAYYRAQLKDKGE